MTRVARIERQLERMIRAYNTYGGGLSKGRLISLVEVPTTSLSGLQARLRHRAPELGHVATSLIVGGEWIYGWADTLYQHQSEHFKRRKNERRSLILSIGLLEQSVREQPEAMNLQHQLVGARNRLAEVDLAISECAKAIGQLKKQIKDV